MTKRFKSLLCLLLAMSCFAVAYAQSYVTFYDNDQEVMASWHLLEVNKMTYEGGNIVVNGQMGTKDFALSNVLSIKFTDEKQIPSSIKDIVSDKDLLNIVAGEQTIQINGANSGRVSIWAVNGQQLYENRSWRGEDIDISHLQRGIYIITINNSTFKFKK